MDKNLKACSHEMVALCDKMIRHLVEFVKENGNLIRTDNEDNSCMTLYTYVYGYDYVVEKKVLAVSTDDEDCLRILVDEYGWCDVSVDADLLVAPTLFNLCDYLGEYVI
jgi:hypothetical protein